MSSSSEPHDVVEEILEEAEVDGETLYKVRWEGFGPEDDTWEPLDHIDHLEALIVYKQKKYYAGTAMQTDCLYSDEVFAYDKETSRVHQRIFVAIGNSRKAYVMTPETFYKTEITHIETDLIHMQDKCDFEVEIYEQNEIFKELTVKDMTKIRYILENNRPTCLYFVEFKETDKKMWAPKALVQDSPSFLRINKRRREVKEGRKMGLSQCLEEWVGKTIKEKDFETNSWRDGKILEIIDEHTFKVQIENTGAVLTFVLGNHVFYFKDEYEAEPNTCAIYMPVVNDLFSDDEEKEDDDENFVPHDHDSDDFTSDDGTITFNRSGRKNGKGKNGRKKRKKKNGNSRSNSNSQSSTKNRTAMRSNYGTRKYNKNKKQKKTTKKSYTYSQEERFDTLKNSIAAANKRRKRQSNALRPYRRRTTRRQPAGSKASGATKTKSKKRKTTKKNPRIKRAKSPETCNLESILLCGSPTANIYPPTEDNNFVGRGGKAVSTNLKTPVNHGRFPSGIAQDPVAMLLMGVPPPSAHHSTSSIVPPGSNHISPTPPFFHSSDESSSLYMSPPKPRNSDKFIGEIDDFDDLYGVPQRRGKAGAATASDITKNHLQVPSSKISDFSLPPKSPPLFPSSGVNEPSSNLPNLNIGGPLNKPAGSIFGMQPEENSNPSLFTDFLADDDEDDFLKKKEMNVSSSVSSDAPTASPDSIFGSPPSELLNSTKKSGDLFDMGEKINKDSRKQSYPEVELQLSKSISRSPRKPDLPPIKPPSDSPYTSNSRKRKHVGDDDAESPYGGGDGYHMGYNAENLSPKRMRLSVRDPEDSYRSFGESQLSSKSSPRTHFRRSESMNSIYKGVSCVMQGSKKIWNAEIEYKRKVMFIGSFSSEIEAADAVDEMSKKLGMISPNARILRPQYPSLLYYL